jgi:colanic acid biosynthesis glycosyl transferase WcaI
MHSNNKRILVLGINFSPELTGIGKYTGEMVAWLAENNYDCTVVTSFPYYPYWKIQSPHSGRWYKKERSQDGKQTIYRCPMYVPSKPTGLKRIIHEATFCFSALFVIFMLLFKKRHDHIFCMAPPFHLGFLGLFYRFFKGGKMVYHIHDMQIEAARDLEIIKTKSVFNILFGMERYILEHTDFVSTVALGMKKKIVKKTTKDVLYFPNWVTIENFWRIDNDPLAKNIWGFQEQDKVVLYSGSLGEKQGLETLINIAQSLKNEKAIKFVICGTGPYKDRLIQMANEKKLDNFFFLPLQELNVFNRFLNMADVHLVIQKKNACDLMMPSKLTNILAVGGLALVTADPGTNLYEVVDEHKMGFLVPSENEEALMTAILTCCKENFTELKSNGRKYVEEHLNRHNILEQVLVTVGSNPKQTEVVYNYNTLQTPDTMKAI